MPFDNRNFGFLQMNASIVCLVELLILRNSKGNFQFQRLVCIIADLNLDTNNQETYVTDILDQNSNNDDQGEVTGNDENEFPS